MTKTNIFTYAEETFDERHLDETVEAEFLDVIGTKVLLFTVNSTNGFYSPLEQASCKLVSNVNIV